MGPLTVLIIDDEKNFGQFVKMNLELIAGYSVIVAENGKQGIREAKKNKPDCILLKKNSATMKIPVIMLSAKDEDDIKLKASERYADLYLTKPIEAIEIKENIEKLLSMRNLKAD